MKDPLVTATVRTLAPLLVGCRVQRIHRRALAGGYCFQVHGQGRTHRLLLQTASPQDRLHLLTTDDPWRVPADSVTLLLRQHLLGAAITGVQRADDDRRVTLELVRGEERYRFELELFGTHGGWALVGSGGDVLHAFGPSTRRRGLRSGVPWSPAPGGSPAAEEASGDSSDAACEALHAKEDRRLLDDERRRQVRSIAAARARIERGLRAAREDARAAEGHADLRHEADLLQTVRGRLPRGAARAEVSDWLQGGARRTLSLNPAHSLEYEIERRYRRARRLERAGPALESRRRTLLARMEALLQQEKALEALDDDILREIARDRLSQPRAQARASAQVRRQPWMQFVSSDGLDLLVGRGSKENDTLTFQVARGSDVWFHAEDFSGAHVILRVPRGTQPPHRSVEEAALLAAIHSGGHQDGVVTVRYTERKHLRKPSGLGPGRVLLAAARSLDVRLAPEKVEAILARRKSEAPT